MKSPFFHPRIAVLALLCCLFLAATARATDADILFTNGSVYTADARDTVAEALAVKDGRIVFVGAAGEAGAFAGPGTETVDLAGGLLLPGFIDTHIHMPGPLMVDLFDINLMDITDPDEMLRTVAKAIRDNPDKDAYFGFGYAGFAFTGPEAAKGPRKERLDGVCADKPVVIFAFDGHSFWMNSRAFEASGITSATPAPVGGVIEKDDATGELWGTVKDNAMPLVKLPPFDPDKERETLEEFLRVMNAYGYTAILAATSYQPGLGEVPWEALDRLEAENRLTLKIRGSICAVPADDPTTIVEQANQLRQRHIGDLLRLTSIKFFADGVMDTRTALLLKPYADEPDNHGLAIWSPEKMREAFLAMNTAGLQNHTHAIGDGAVRMTLDAYEYVCEHGPAGDYRNAITHLQLVDPRDLPRFRALSVVASTQPYWHRKEPGYWREVEYEALGERAEREYPLKSLFDAGAVVVSSSDSPVTMDLNPLIAIQIGVTRNYPNDGSDGLPDITDPDDPALLLNAAERATVKQMIRSFTANGAYALFMEQETGSLEKGKWADLVVLDRNILECPPLEIGTAEVRRTYVNGHLVYDAGITEGEHKR